MKQENTPAATIERIIEAAQKEGGLQRAAPVHLWNPPYCGEIDIHIARDGTWFYLGTPIGRPELVKLFASVLKREGEEYFLVTPVEKLRIAVEDAPFLAVDFDRIETSGKSALLFQTSLGDKVVAGPEAPIRVAFCPETHEPSPYVMVRSGLEALLDRKSFFRLVEEGEIAEINGEEWFGIWSAGMFFQLLPASELE